MKTSLLVLIVAVAFSLGCATPANAPHGPLTAQKGFASPEQAGDAFIQAAASYNVPALLEILGPDGKDLVATDDRVGDRLRAEAFTAKAREKHMVATDPGDPSRMNLVVGNDEWPFPIPLIREGGNWYFDTAAGRDEIMKRRIGADELDAITILRGYVEAQEQYASEIHDNSGVNQYAQRVISTPGKHDGLAWQNEDGSWGGPVGVGAARAIEQGYAQGRPFHGYYFKVLEGQGPAARLGQLDYLVGSAMIGGFAMVAWPAEYAVTGVQSFIVSYDGVVYQKDLGAETARIASDMDRYNPDNSWKRTDDNW